MASHKIMSELTPKPIRASRITLSQLMHPVHANLLGNVNKKTIRPRTFFTGGFIILSTQ